MINRVFLSTDFLDHPGQPSEMVDFLDGQAFFTQIRNSLSNNYEVWFPIKPTDKPNEFHWMKGIYLISNHENSYGNSCRQGSVDVDKISDLVFM